MHTKQARDKILDSLVRELNILAGKIKLENEKNKLTIEEFTQKRYEYEQRKETFEADNSALTKKYDEEIVTQFTQYVKDFGKKNNYTYIFGNDGNGSLMYAVESKDITKEVANFINNKYSGVE